MKEITDLDCLEEAYNCIKEWGINSDNYVGQNFKYIMCGGEPSDNSCELWEYHVEMLQQITTLGLETASKKLKWLWLKRRIINLIKRKP